MTVINKKFNQIKLLLDDFFSKEFTNNEDDLIQLGRNLGNEIKNFDEPNQHLSWELVSQKFLKEGMQFGIATWSRRITYGASQVLNSEEQLKILKTGMKNAVGNINKVISPKKLH